MTLRISTNQATSAFIDQMFRQRQQLTDVQNEISTGVKVSKPSDDPASAGSIAEYQSALTRIQRHQDRISQGTGLLQVQESALQEANNLLVRAKELAAQGANETLSSEQRAQMSVEVFGIRDALVNLANTRYQTSYVWGGIDSDDPPFGRSVPLTYPDPNLTNPNDPAGIRYDYDGVAPVTPSSVRVNDSTTVRLQTDGAAVWLNAIAGVERLGRALAGYDTTPVADTTTPTPATFIPDGGGLALTLPAQYDAQTSLIIGAMDIIDYARTNDIIREQTSLGSRVNNLEQADSVLSTIKSEIDQSRSTLQDTDVAEAAARFSNLQLALQGLYASGTQINRLSLLDFL